MGQNIKHWSGNDADQRAHDVIIFIVVARKSMYLNGQNFETGRISSMYYKEKTRINTGFVMLWLRLRWLAEIELYWGNYLPVMERFSTLMIRRTLLYVATQV